jgi:hypothetical protein
MTFVAFIEDSRAIDRIIDHLKLTFVAENLPAIFFEQGALLPSDSGSKGRRFESSPARHVFP